MQANRYDRTPDGGGYAYPRYRATTYASAAGRTRAPRPQEWRTSYAEDDDDEPAPPQRSGRRRKHMPLWQELPLLLVVAFCLAVLIRTFLLQAFFIPSGSMENTLLVGDRVLVNKVVYDMRDPRRGEVVVFRGTNAWAPETATLPVSNAFMARLGRTIGDLVGVGRPGEKDFIKRVIGLPGDKVACCDSKGRLTVNGQPMDEPYVIENSPLDVPPNPRECRSRRFAEVTVPPGQIWVMGDHRLVSQDSRCQGPVPIDNVIGRAFIVVWPSSRWTGLPVPQNFVDVPLPDAADAAGPRDPQLRPVSPVTPGTTGGIAVVMPILLSSLFPARSRLSARARQRRLSE